MTCTKCGANEFAQHKNIIIGFMIVGLAVSILDKNIDRIIASLDSTSEKVEKDVVRIESAVNANTDELIIKKVEALLTDAIINGRNGKKPPITIDEVKFHNGTVVRKGNSVSACGELSLKSGVETSFKMRYVALPDGGVAIEDARPTVINPEFEANWAKNCATN